MVINTKLEIPFVPICIGSRTMQIGISTTAATAGFEGIAPFSVEMEGVYQC